MTDLECASIELRDAVDFFDRVQKSSVDEQITAGRDHWEWLETAARKVAKFAPEKEEKYRS